MADMQWELRRVGDEAYLESIDGFMLANLYRTASREGTKVTRLVEADCSQFDASPNATTDEQWQSIVDCIAAAPEMLAACKEMVRAFEKGDNVDELVALRSIKDAIAKAEPPRKAKRRMLVTVEVEVEGDADAPTDVFKSHALDFVYTGGGVGTRFMGKTVTTLGELYED